jgi:hypothetical protein
MTFEDLLNDVEKLIGLRLNSIRPGAEIIIESIDRKNGSLSLRNVQGSLRKRNLDELKNLWKELQKSRIVHVDGFLHGSGSSRNQPETILANLPYIEWLKYNGKKHLANVEKPTHAYGTLKKMNSVDQINFCEQLSHCAEKRKFAVAVVTNEIKESIDAFNSESAYEIGIIEQGAYLITMPNGNMLFLSSEKYKIANGVYPVLKRSANPVEMQEIKVNDFSLHLAKIDGIKVLLV